jgi:tetratricopeptide (TPR) repeat protein
LDKLPLPKLKKFLALSLPLGLAMAIFAPGQTPAVGATSDSSTMESPAQLRLTALDTLMKGDKHSALDIYEEAIRLANRQFGSDSTFLGDLYYEAGRLYLELDQFNQAEDYLRQAVKINPKNASARLALARLLDTREKVQESIGQIREALLINPSSPVARQKFIQILSKYGQSPSDKAIATQESLNLAMMEKSARETLQRSSANNDKKAENKTRGQGSSGKKANGEAQHSLSVSVPSLPKNLAPLKEEEEKAAAKSDSFGAQSPTEKNNTATKSDIKPEHKDAAKTDGKSDAKATTSASSGLSLFPLKGLSQRKEQEARNKEIQERALKKMQEMQKTGGAPDIVDKIKEQAHQRGKARAAERAEKAEKARAAKAAKAEAKTAKSEPKATKSEPKAAQSEPKAAQSEPKAAQSEAKSSSKPAEKQNTAKPEQAPPQMMQMQTQYMPTQGMYQQPVFRAPPKAKAGKGFVPPPPPTINTYMGMPMPMVPQTIQQQQPKAAVAKPKVDKPKAAPKEEAKPAEDKPPPMTTTGDSDSEFLLDWGELPKNKGKKKAK